MGFRCPECGKDFGKDQDALVKHCIKENVDLLDHIKQRAESDRKKVRV